MIRVHRVVPPPAQLIDQGSREQELFAVLHDQHCSLHGPDGFKFRFNAYKAPEVKAALDQLFHGKCGYCETFYGAAHPLEIDHFRPKGSVADEPLHPGYYWLAAEWTNLIPSCIHCNRRNRHRHNDTGDTRVTGKGDHFPLDPTGQRATGPDGHLAMEKALLVDPSSEDPADFVGFDDSGVIMVPKALDATLTERSSTTIDLLGLNRADLVWDRWKTIQTLDWLLRLIERALKSLRETMELGLGRDELSAQIADLFRELEAQAAPAAEYSAMVQNLIETSDVVRSTPDRR